MPTFINRTGTLKVVVISTVDRGQYMTVLKYGRTCREWVAVGTDIRRVEDLDKYGVNLGELREVSLTMPKIRPALTYDKIPRRDQPWFWEGFIPEGLVVPLISPPACGKTTVLEDVAARFSRGDANPDGTPGIGEPCQILFVSAEDDPETSVGAKLDEAGAVSANIIDGSGGLDGDGFQLDQQNVDWLRAQFDFFSDIKLIIIDTLTKTATRSIGNGPALKAMMRPLNILAKDKRVAIVIPTHTLKDGKTYAGAKELISEPRHVLQITKNKDDPSIRTLGVLKSNIYAEDEEGVSFRLVGTGKHSKVEYLWGQGREPGVTGPAPTGQAKILAVLRQNGPMGLHEIASRTGIEYKTAAVLLNRMKGKGSVAHLGKLYELGADEAKSVTG